ncbi:TPA: hypothetical protein NI607_003340 [Pseudomonas aeruginosa]|nr:hypothetical protein [Pseudomonas aeruginosa]HCF9259174.1 hypothetical protein [Pseudomonas aeruginosa]HCF9324026.1 hypothetical protein [Pseudomonas aeruginosa]HCF9389344.1 hypothetical protein [Pseudomonas aeruginosa]HCF9402559.1 hypothetical protein [Pseudomonas aeruginosa]
MTTCRFSGLHLAVDQLQVGFVAGQRLVDLADQGLQISVECALHLVQVADGDLGARKFGPQLVLGIAALVHLAAHFAGALSRVLQLNGSDLTKAVEYALLQCNAQLTGGRKSFLCRTYRRFLLTTVALQSVCNCRWGHSVTNS